MARAATGLSLREAMQRRQGTAPAALRMPSRGLPVAQPRRGAQQQVDLAAELPGGAELEVRCICQTQ